MYFVLRKYQEVPATMNKILIVEDEEAIADLEKDYLELSGFEVEIAHRWHYSVWKAHGMRNLSW